MRQLKSLALAISVVRVTCEYRVCGIVCEYRVYVKKTVGIQL